jgi:UrcA family protein
VLIHKVNFKDMDLNREAGARTLCQRIKAAAECVCAPLNGRRLIEQLNQAACVTSTIERAVQQVNEPMLTYYYSTIKPKSGVETSLALRR